MDLETKVNTKPSILKKLAKKAMPYILAASLGLSIISCKHPDPVLGPIYVENTMTPTIIPYGDMSDWEVKVTNDGDEIVTIERAEIHEDLFIGGEKATEYTNPLPIEIFIPDKRIYPGATDIIFAMYNVIKKNESDFDFVWKNTVTVYSDGGNASDTCTYTRLPKDEIIEQ